MNAHHAEYEQFVKRFLCERSVSAVNETKVQPTRSSLSTVHTVLPASRSLPFACCQLVTQREDAYAGNLDGEMTSFPCAAHLLSLSLLALSHFFGTASCASAAQWRSRSIYQVLTDRFVHDDGSDNSTSVPCAVEQGLYCGGQWSGIKSRLDYIQGMGFDAVWISPITAQLPQRTGDGEAYTGYWQQDLYALNSKFGTAEELKDLIGEMHSRGMYIMLDLVGKRHPDRPSESVLPSY